MPCWQAWHVTKRRKSVSIVRLTVDSVELRSIDDLKQRRLFVDSCSGDVTPDYVARSLTSYLLDVFDGHLLLCRVGNEAAA